MYPYASLNLGGIGVLGVAGRKSTPCDTTWFCVPSYAQRATEAAIRRLSADLCDEYRYWLRGGAYGKRTTR